MERHLVAKTGWNVSALSFGCMRFKDEETAVAAVHQAIDLGVNYFDVAPLYGGGSAEPRLGLGIRGRREGILVTAKSSPGNGGAGLTDYSPEKGFGIRTADEARRQIERSMKLLGVDHLDMYQLWACHGDPVFEEAMRPGGFMEGVLKARDEGLFDYIGMTTHSGSDDIIRYVSESVYEFDMVTLPFHVHDTSRARAVAWLAERGIGVVAMNPLAGGRLAKKSPVLQRIAADLGFGSFLEAALRFVAGYPGVATALNGITFAAQAVEGVDALKKGEIPRATQVALEARVREVYENVKHFCTACGYCGECPVGIRIPEVLELFSSLLLPTVASGERVRLLELMAADPESYDPSLCEACRACEEKCPNKLPIADLMAEAARVWPAA